MQLLLGGGVGNIGGVECVEELPLSESMSPTVVVGLCVFDAGVCSICESSDNGGQC